MKGNGSESVSNSKGSIEENGFSLEVSALDPYKKHEKRNYFEEDEEIIEGEISNWNLSPRELDDLFKLIMPNEICHPDISNLIRAEFDKDKFKKFSETVCKVRESVYCIFGLSVIKDRELQQEAREISQRIKKQDPAASKNNSIVLKEWVGIDDARKKCVLFAANAFDEELL